MIFLRREYHIAEEKEITFLLIIVFIYGFIIGAFLMTAVQKQDIVNMCGGEDIITQ